MRHRVLFLAALLAAPFPAKPCAHRSTSTRVRSTSCSSPPLRRHADTCSSTSPSQSAPAPSSPAPSGPSTRRPTPATRQAPRRTETPAPRGRTAAPSRDRHEATPRRHAASASKCANHDARSPCADPSARRAHRADPARAASDVTLPPPIVVPIRPRRRRRRPPWWRTPPATLRQITGGLRITFGPGSSDLNPRTDAAIRALVHEAPPFDTTTFTVTTYAAGTAEDPSTPRRLSLSRALAIRSVLISEGVTSVRIYVKALGATGDRTGRPTAPTCRPPDARPPAGRDARARAHAAARRNQGSAVTTPLPYLLRMLVFLAAVVVVAALLSASLLLAASAQPSAEQPDPAGALRSALPGTFGRSCGSRPEVTWLETFQRARTRLAARPRRSCWRRWRACWPPARARGGTARSGSACPRRRCARCSTPSRAGLTKAANCRAT